MLTLAFFYKLAFTDLILGRGDTYNYFYPYWDVRNEALAKGKLPLWTPDIFMGAPLLADPQLGTFYPPNWLTVPFDAPNAVRLSVLVHIMWAILGTYLLARNTLLLARLPSLLAGVVFGLGGYVTSHVEQVNQLQGLAWLPWLFLTFHLALKKPLRYTPLLAIGWALQLFTGHTQTVFITLIGLLVYSILNLRLVPARPVLRKIVIVGMILSLAGLLALLLATPQLIPTLELMGLSNRSGGLNQNQATAFSLSPFVMGRGLLPSYDGQLFSEYVAYPGIVALGLAVIGVMLGGHKTPPTVYTGGTTGVLVHEGGRIGSDVANRVWIEFAPRIVWLIIALLGLTFALGFYNPLYWTLASLPGFNLFRVPARWLALFALGVALLSGMGANVLLLEVGRISRRVFTVVVALVALLVWQSLAMALAPPEDIIGPAIPTLRTLVGWAGALVGLLAIMFLLRIPPHYRVLLLLAGIFAELFVAAHMLPLNHLTPPDVYTGQRFTISQLLAFGEEQTPPGRVLSISRLQFDPGDKATLEARYHQRNMSDLAIRNALVAVKRQEMLFPNLSLTWGIPTIDGYGGGLLPTIYYTQFTSLLLPDGEPRTIDGRLGEILATPPECRGDCIPDSHWLNLTNTRYLIVDKVYDVVQEGIFYDTALPVRCIPTFCTQYRIPEFGGDAVEILYTGTEPPTLSLRSGGVEVVPTTVETLSDVTVFRRARYTFAEMPVDAQLNLSASDELTLVAATLVDTRTGDFLQLSPFPYQRVLSSDIKIYENLLVWSRAYADHQVSFLPDTAEGSEGTVQYFRSADYLNSPQEILYSDERFTIPSAPDLPVVEIVHYEAQRVEVQVTTSTETVLVLTDAYYPGWMATVNGQPTTIYRANVMFRAVRVPAGQSTVVFEYKPAWLPGAFILGAAAWIATAGLIVWLWRRSRLNPAVRSR
jgi:hypothetical protein